MEHFKKILVAIDMDASADQVLTRAVQVASDNNAEVSVVFAVYKAAPIHGGYIGEVVSMNNSTDVDEEALRKDIQQKIRIQAQDIGLSSANIIVEFGRAVDVILDVAEAENSDLIMVGSHGRHGVALLLGSTANGVLHRAKCDVLAVRVSD